MIFSQNHNNFDKEKWEEVIDGKDFKEDFEEEKEEKEEKEESKIQPQSTSLPLFGQGFSLFSYIILALIIGFVIFFIVKMLSEGQTGAQKLGKATLRYDDDRLEENIHDLDLIQLLNQAVESGDFRAAIRIKFLITIKRLSENAMISWKKDKTNWEYHKEITDPNLKNGLNDLINFYEKVWYGNIDLIPNDYYKLEPFYDRFNNRIKV